MVNTFDTVLQHNAVQQSGADTTWDFWLNNTALRITSFLQQPLTNEIMLTTPTSCNHSQLSDGAHYTAVENVTMGFQTDDREKQQLLLVGISK